MSDKHQGSKSIADFFGWDSNKWRTHPPKIIRNVAAGGIALLLSALGATGLMRCDWFGIFCN